MDKELNEAQMAQMEKFHTVNVLLTLICKELGTTLGSWNEIVTAHQELLKTWSELSGQTLQDSVTVDGTIKTMEKHEIGS